MIKFHNMNNNWTFESFNEANNYIQTNYKIIHFNNGHIKNTGRHAGIYKNPYWIVNDVYYHEWLNEDRTREREFFKVEKHPKLIKPWISTKSNKISIFEKLNQANKVVDDLEKDIYPCKI